MTETPDPLTPHPLTSDPTAPRPQPPGKTIADEDRERLGGFVLDLELRRLRAPEDQLVFELDNMPYRSNSSGLLHGGMIATLIDCTAGLLAYEGVDEQSMTTTTNLSINYLAPVRKGPARATARILRRGRKSIVVDVQVHDADTDVLAAVATASFMVVVRRDAPQLAEQADAESIVG